MSHVSKISTPPVDEFVALGLLTLREHTERAGGVLNAEILRASIEKSLKVSEFCIVRRNGDLAAYAMLQPETPTCWFVTGFITHPDYRTPPVLREFFSAFMALVQQLGIIELRSNVYKTNPLSLAFHKRLGFHITRENSQAVEFAILVKEMSANKRKRPIMQALDL